MPNASLKYLWEQAVLQAFMEFRAEYVPAKISVAERVIGERLRDHSAEDLEEQLALRDSLQALQRLAPKQAERKQESGEQNE
jgi:hypothetical protein